MHLIYKSVISVRGGRIVPGMVALLGACLAQIVLSPPGFAVGNSPIEPAIVLIEVTQQRGDWYSPWQRTRPVQSSGSGFLIGPGLVMTNAHVVSDAKQIKVRRHGGKRPYFANIRFIAHDSDLAILEVSDPDFSQGVTPLAIGDLPSLRSRVRTYGYPAGGEQISRTEGVVSRIQIIQYLHTEADHHLGIQTDSAINPGNSGGPVIQEGKVIGVAFQTNTRLNDVGYFIPSPVINRFLADIKDGTYNGYVDLGVVTSNLLNPVYRKFLKLPDDETGVVVDRIYPGSSADGHVLPGDVIMAVDGVPVLSDGNIDYFGYSLNYIQIVEGKLAGQMLELTLWRHGKALKTRFQMKKFAEADRMRSHFDTFPNYVIYAGLVFMELDRDYLKTFGNYWENADKHLLYSLFFSSIESDRPQPKSVVLSRILPHRLNSAYRGMENYFVDQINGVPIRDLKDIEQGLRASKNGFHHLRLNPGALSLILGKDQAARAHPEILARYGITHDRRLP